ncbi:response regulator, partial [Pseudomonas aeruginosa]
MGKPILIVDDSASIRQMLSFTLKSAGYEVDEAADGKEGLGKAQSKSYSLVFTDQNTPNK